MTAPLALLALDDTTGVEDLVRSLQAAGVRVVVSGAAFETIAAHGLTVEPLTALTGRSLGLGEAVDLGHSSLTGGLSARWRDPRQHADAALAGLARLDLLVVRLPTDTQSLGDFSRLSHGPYQARAHLLRLAATHEQAVGAVVVDPLDFSAVLAAITGESIGAELQATLRVKALQHVADFDELTNQAHGFTMRAPVQQGLMLAPWPVPSTQRVVRLHDPSGWLCGVQPIELVAGPLPDAQTLLTLDAALQMMRWPGGGATAATAINGQPCAFAVSESSLPRAAARALGADPVAAQGGVLACSGAVDVTAARALLRHIHIGGLVVLAASEFTEEATALLRANEGLLLLRMVGEGRYGGHVQLRPTHFGVFTRDVADPYGAEMPPLTQLGKVALSAELAAMTPVALHVCRQLTGQAVALCDGEGSITVCGGQPHAMDGVQVAAAKARRVARPCVAVVNGLLGTPLAVAALHRAKVQALVLAGLGPGAEAMIEAADSAGMALLQLPDDWASATL